MLPLPVVLVTYYFSLMLLVVPSREDEGFRMASAVPSITIPIWNKLIGSYAQNRSQNLLVRATLISSNLSREE